MIGQWSEDEYEEIWSILEKHQEKENPWIIQHHKSGLFTAKRVSWSEGIFSGQSVQSVARKIREHYGDKESLREHWIRTYGSEYHERFQGNDLVGRWSEVDKRKLKEILKKGKAKHWILVYHMTTDMGASFDADPRRYAARLFENNVFTLSFNTNRFEGFIEKLKQSLGVK